jgi:hypothetical protein
MPSKQMIFSSIFGTSANIEHLSLHIKCIQFCGHIVILYHLNEFMCTYRKEL